jgi:hypothetical protein
MQQGPDAVRLAPARDESTPDQLTPLLLAGAGELACSDWLLEGPCWVWLFEVWRFVGSLFEDLSALLREDIVPLESGSRGVVIVLSAGLKVPDALEPPVVPELPPPIAELPLLPAPERLLVSVVLPELLLPEVPAPIALPLAALPDGSGVVVAGLRWLLGSFCEAGGVDIAVDEDGAVLASSSLRLQAVKTPAETASNANVEAMNLGLFMVSPGESPPPGGW